MLCVIETTNLLNQMDLMQITSHMEQQNIRETTDAILNDEQLKHRYKILDKR
jgi:hypothetical protein